MKNFELKGSSRKETGRKASKEARSNGIVPCVVYGGKENVHFEVTDSDIRHLIYSPNVYIVDLTIEGKAPVKAVLKEIQFHPVTDNVMHIDFLEVSDKKPIIMEIPVKLNGLAAGVKAGGKLSLEMRKLKIKGLYKNLPDTLDINIENLGLGKTIQVGELSFDNLEIMNAKNAVVAAVKLTRAARGAMAKGN